MRRFLILVKVLFWTASLMFIVFHLFLLFYGIANPITTIIVYTLIGYFLDRVWVSKVFRFELRITLWTTIVSLVILEMCLRFGVKAHETYGEGGGDWWYACPYGHVRVENMIKMHLQKVDPSIHLGLPFGNFDVENKEFKHQDSYNSLGMRDVDYTQHQLDTSLVVLGLGDSFTEGVGTSRDSTWVKLLEVKLRPEIPNLICINAGSTGSDIIAETYKLKKLLFELYDPDVVVLAINSSDIFDIKIRGGFERFTNEDGPVYRDGPWWTSIYAFSFVFRHVMHDIFKIESDYLTAEQSLSCTNAAKKTIVDVIVNELEPFARQHAFELVIVFTPMEYEIADKEFALEEVYDQLTGNSQVLNTLNVYHSMALKDSNEVAQHYWRIDGHCTPKGYDYWASEIAQLFRNKLENDQLSLIDQAVIYH